MDYIFRWPRAKFLGQEYAVTEAGANPGLRATESDPQQVLLFAPKVMGSSFNVPFCSWFASCYNVGTLLHRG